MKKNLPLFPAVAVLLTHTTAACNMHTFFSCTASNDYAYIELWPWVLLTLASFFILHFFLKQERPLGQLAVVIATCFAVTVAVMSLFFIHVEGVVAWLTAWAFLAYTMLRACTLNLGEGDAQTVLLCCELPVMGIPLLLWVRTSEVCNIPTYYISSAIFVLLLSFIALTSIRMEHANDATHAQKLTAIGTTTLCFGVIGAVCYGFIQFAATYMATAVSATSALLMRICTAIFAALNAFLLWFVSLFPAGEMEALDAVPAETVAVADTSVSEEMNTTVLIFMAIALALLILGAVIWLIFRFRKVAFRNVQGRANVYRRPRQVVERVSLWARFVAFVQRKYHRLRFWLTVLYKRNTPQGAVILLSHLGKKRGMAQQTGESYRKYLLRLAAQCTADDKAQHLLHTLADTLDQTLYAPTSTAQGLCAKEYRYLRKTARKLPKTTQKG